MTSPKYNDPAEAFDQAIREHRLSDIPASPYIIKRLDQNGGYVSQPGSAHSYTQDPLKARQYLTRQAAEADLCVDNEAIEPAYVKSE